MEAIFLFLQSKCVCLEYPSSVYSSVLTLWNLAQIPRSLSGISLNPNLDYCLLPRCVSIRVLSAFPFPPLFLSAAAMFLPGFTTEMVCKLSWLFTAVSPGPQEVNIYLEDKLKTLLQAEVKRRGKGTVSPHHPGKGKGKKTQKDILPLRCSSYQSICDAALAKHPQLRPHETGSQKQKKAQKTHKYVKMACP